MGVVYAAVRADDEYRRKVAVKLLSGFLHTDEEMRQFRRERQILADLDHPNIARLLDGGTTAAGEPFLVMEYVEGLPIHEYVERNGLPEHDRLRLFQLLCDAVSCAHRHLIVHSDLKPSNVLVTCDGIPKLLDFGIARRLATDDALRGQTGIMTPDYASPEQIVGERLTIASDVYSLGVLLFLMLTGRHPFRGPGGTEGRSIRQATFESEPESYVRGALSKDLGHIVCMALRRDPALRYGSVEQLSEDLLRYCEGRPVRARRRTLVYRSGRWLRRHRLAMCMAVTAAGLGTYSAVSKINEFREGERRFDESRRRVNSFIFEIPDALAGVPGSLAARQPIVVRATGYLDDMTREAGDNRVLRSELAAAYNRIGTITFDVSRSLSLHRKAAEMVRALVRAEPRNRKYRQQLAASVALVADMLREEGDLAGAAEGYREALDASRNLARSAPRVPAYQAELADACDGMGTILAQTGEWRQSLALYFEALPIWQRLAADHPGETNYRRSLMTTYGQLARGLTASGQYAEARAYQDMTSAAASRLFGADPSSTASRRDLWWVLMNESKLSSKTGNGKVALLTYRRALAMIQSLSAADPGDRGHRHGVAVNELAIGDALAALGRANEAIATFEQAVVVSGILLAADPKKIESGVDLARINSHLGKSYLAVHDRRRASACFHRAKVLFDGVSASQSRNPVIRAEAAELADLLAKRDF